MPSHKTRRRPSTPPATSPSAGRSFPSPSSWPWSAQYALALGVIAGAIGIRWAMDPLVGPGDVPFVSVLVAFSLRPAGTGAGWEMALFGASGGAAVLAAWISRRVQSRRVEAERELSRRGEEIRLVTDAVPAPIAYVDANLPYRFVNARYADWFGRPAEEIVGREYTDPGGRIEVELRREDREAVGRAADRRGRLRRPSDQAGQPRTGVARPGKALGRAPPGRRRSSLTGPAGRTGSQFPKPRRGRITATPPGGSAAA